MEARSLPAEQSKPLIVKVKDYKTDLNALKEQVKKATSLGFGGDAARAELVSKLQVAHTNPSAAWSLRALPCLCGLSMAAIVLISALLNVLQGLGGDYYSTSAGQRDRMLTATQRLEKTSEVLQYGKEQLVQTEVSRNVVCGFLYVSACTLMGLHCVHACVCAVCVRQRSPAPRHGPARLLVWRCWRNYSASGKGYSTHSRRWQGRTVTWIRGTAQ